MDTSKNTDSKMPPSVQRKYDKSVSVEGDSLHSSAVPSVGGMFDLSNTSYFGTTEASFMAQGTGGASSIGCSVGENTPSQFISSLLPAKRPQVRARLRHASKCQVVAQLPHFRPPGASRRLVRRSRE